MKDRDRETDPLAETTTVDTDPLGVDRPDDDEGDASELRSEEDQEEFWRWLPTLGIAHRRRKELVERPSSDGAPFAAYAGATRPAAATRTAKPPATIAVHIESAVIEGSRDALTVVKPRRGARWSLPGIALGATAVVAATVAIAAWSYVSTRYPASRAPAAAAITASASVYNPGAADIAAASSALPTQESPTAARISATSSPPPNPVGSEDAARRRDASGPSRRAAESPARRAPRSAPSAASLSKDQFFEVP